MVFSSTTVMEIFRGLHTLINRSRNTVKPSIGNSKCDKYQKFDFALKTDVDVINCIS